MGYDKEAWKKRGLTVEEVDLLCDRIDAISDATKAIKGKMSDDKLAGIVAEHMTGNKAVDREMLAWVRLSVVARRANEPGQGR
jgi:hypothetical protein